MPEESPKFYSNLHRFAQHIMPNVIKPEPAKTIPGKVLKPEKTIPGREFPESVSPMGSVIPAYREADKVIPAKAQPEINIPAMPAAGKLHSMITGHGIHPEEMRHFEVQDYLNGLGPDDEISKEDFLRHIESKIPKFEEHVNSDDLRPLVSEDEEINENHRPRWQRYSLPNGGNYREILSKIEPFLDSANYIRSHWGPNHKNVVNHLRLTDRAVDDGKRSLHLEENQSDWSKDGSRYGYKQLKTPSYKEWLDDFKGTQAYSDMNYRLANRDATDAEYEKLFRKEYEASVADGSIFQRRDIPAGNPFPGTSHELGLKRALYEAAKNDKDKLTWSTGDQIGNLVRTFDNNDALNRVYGHIDQNTGEQTHGHFGKFLNRYLAKHGQKVGKSKTILPNGIPDNYGVQTHYDNDGNPIISVTDQDGNLINTFDDMRSAITYVDDNSGHPQNSQWVHSVDLTPEMKRDILENGQPLWGTKDVLQKSLVYFIFPKGSSRTELIKSFVRGHFMTQQDGQVNFVSPHVDSRVHHAAINSMKQSPLASLSPQEDWLVNGTMSNLFKKWFGNSVVLNSHKDPLTVYPLVYAPNLEGKMVRVCDEVPNDEFLPRFVSKTSPFGTAYYFTYSKEEFEKQSSTSGQSKDLCKVHPNHRSKILKKHIDNDTANYYDIDTINELSHLFYGTGDLRVLRDANINDPYFVGLLNHHSSLIKEKMSPCYLRMSTPLDLSLPIGQEKLRQITNGNHDLENTCLLAAHRRLGDLKHDWAQDVTGSDIFNAISMMGDSFDFAVIAQRAGYDGIIYKPKGIDSEVYVVFNSSQIKSKHNRGGFNLKSTSIFKSK